MAGRILLVESISYLILFFLDKLINITFSHDLSAKCVSVGGTGTTGRRSNAAEHEHSTGGGGAVVGHDHAAPLDFLAVVSGFARLESRSTDCA
jgi:hypothetical protein